MPLSKHYKGHGKEVMANMQKEYGSKKGERVFYATENKMKKMHRTAMGRQVIHHSPDKHPEQGDQMTPEQMDQKTEEATKQQTGTYSNQRQIMKPFQQNEPRDTSTKSGGYLDYLKKMLPGGSK